jgi:hypothetical protein
MWAVPVFPPPPADMVAQLLKRAGKCMWCPERVIRATGGGDAAAGAQCSRGGVPCFRNRSETGHMLAELGDEVSWMYWVGGQSQ